MDVVYSYRPSPFACPQFVHRSGVAFIQVLGKREGFRWLKNRLLQVDKGGYSSTKDAMASPNPDADAEELQQRLTNFCSDAEELTRYYDKMLAALPSTPTDAGGIDETPPVSATMRPS